MNRLLPLCVGLNGTLVRSDLLFESVLALVASNPLFLFVLPFWVLGGRAAFKDQVARRVTLNPSVLPYNKSLLDWLKGEAADGRKLWLCTGSNTRLASAITGHLGLFEGAIASDAALNVRGGEKARQLVARFGARGFDYCGNHRIDLAVWQQAHAAIMVDRSAALNDAVGRSTTVEREFRSRRSRLRALIKAMRIHQWVKNVLVFLPALAAHTLLHWPTPILATLAFVAFSLCASSVYLLNDMLDLEADRRHPRKCKRPFASGELPLWVGFVLAPLLLLATGGIALFLPLKFSLVLIAYYATTLAYSFLLKRLVVVDAFALAGLYTIRMVAGAAAVSVELSFWMLLFSVFLFLSLAIVKRYAELLTMSQSGELQASGRGYRIGDLPILQALGTAASYLSVLVLALYINSTGVETLYRHPKALWMLCGLALFWTSWVWLKAHRGEMHYDPVIFAFRDPVSRGIGVLGFLAVLAAI